MINRDGDMVTIRVSQDGNTLDIKDNHSPDPTAVTAEPEVESQTI